MIFAPTEEECFNCNLCRQNLDYSAQAHCETETGICVDCHTPSECLNAYLCEQRGNFND